MDGDLKREFRKLVRGSPGAEKHWSSRVFWGRAGENTKFPFGLLRVVSGSGTHHTRGRSSLRRANVQLTIYAQSRSDQKDRRPANASTILSQLGDHVARHLDGMRNRGAGAIYVESCRLVNSTDVEDPPQDKSDNWILGLIQEYEIRYRLSAAANA